MSPRPPAVVFGLDNITGLQTARILAGRGVPVIGIAKDVDHFCCRTRVCERIMPADTGTEGLVEALEALGPDLDDRAVLFPCDDRSVAVISRYRERLAPWFHVVLPAHEIVERLMDKLSFTNHALEHGLLIPPTRLLRSRADAEAAADTSGGLPYPAVLKPSLKSPGWSSHTREKAFKVADGRELLAVYDRIAAWTDVLIAQAWVPGDESNLYSCNCYFNVESRPLVTFVARKIRQWPPQTGISAMGEECRNDAVLDEAIRLFSGAGFHGLGYVEMKRDERTGEHFIIEPNIGRPTGRSAIAEAGGVELLYTKYCDVVGLPLPSNRVQRYTGAKWIYARNDIRSAIHYWKRNELTLSEWWRSMRGSKVDAVISWRDPAPFIFDVWRAARLAWAARAEQ